MQIERGEAGPKIFYQICISHRLTVMLIIFQILTNILWSKRILKIIEKVRQAYTPDVLNIHMLNLL